MVPLKCTVHCETAMRRFMCKQMSFDDEWRTEISTAHIACRWETHVHCEDSHVRSTMCRCPPGMCNMCCNKSRSNEAQTHIDINFANADDELLKGCCQVHIPRSPLGCHRSNNGAIKWFWPRGLVAFGCFAPHKTVKLLTYFDAKQVEMYSNSRVANVFDVSRTVSKCNKSVWWLNCRQKNQRSVARTFLGPGFHATVKQHGVTQQLSGRFWLRQHGTAHTPTTYFECRVRTGRLSVYPPILRIMRPTYSEALCCTLSAPKPPTKKAKHI